MRRRFTVTLAILGFLLIGPIIQPVSAAQSVKITKIWVDHNYMQGNEKGLRIHAAIVATDLRQISLTVVSYFYFSDGKPLKDFNQKYRTQDGSVSVSTKIVPLYNSSSFSDVSMFIPYSELHMEPATNPYSLKFRMQVFLTGPSTPMTSSDFVSFSMNVPFPRYIQLYKGNNGQGSFICSIPFENRFSVINMKSNVYRCTNDDARSLRLDYIPKGWMITVFDDSNCTTNDDWTTIRVLQDIRFYTVNTFQRSYRDQYVDVRYQTTGNLDGKVSCIRIEPAN